MKKLTIWENEHGSFDAEIREDGIIISATMCIPTWKDIHNWVHDHKITLEEWLQATIHNDPK